MPLTLTAALTGSAWRWGSLQFGTPDHVAQLAFGETADWRWLDEQVPRGPGWKLLVLGYEWGARKVVGSAHALDANDEYCQLPWAWCATFAEKEVVRLAAHTAAANRGRISGFEDLPAWVTASTPQERYFSDIEEIRRHLRAGDSYQVNYTQRFSAVATRSTWDLHAHWSAAQPAPYSCFIQTTTWGISGHSPELFLEYDSGTRQLHTRPIKGTRPRGQNAAADNLLKNELAASEKDRAEHLMIVDLARNDLGRICEYGSIQAAPLMEPVTYPGLHHLETTVSGRLKEAVPLSAIFSATFPGGSITGAPKKRTMEIIKALEPVPRGFYCGAIGVVDPAGNFQFNLPIRTAVQLAGRVYYHSGGGITWLSNPAGEYAESLVKAAPYFEMTRPA